MPGRALIAVAIGLSGSPALANAKAPPPWHYGSMASASLGVDADLNGAVPFRSDNAWNTDVSGKDVDPDSDDLIGSIGLDTGLHPDFGSGTMIMRSSRFRTL